MRMTSSLDSKNAFLLKLVFVGSGGVGKSNILTRFVSDEFNLQSAPTKGFEFAQIHFPVDQLTYNFHLWDAQGVQRPRAACQAYYRNAVAVLLVYDVTNYESFLDCEEIWYPEIREFAPQHTTVILVGSKTDLSNLREVPTEEAALFAREHQINFFEVSALTYENIEQLFQTLARTIDTSIEMQDQSSASVSVDQHRPENIDEEVNEFLLLNEHAGSAPTEPAHALRGTKQTLFTPPIKQFNIHVYFDSRDEASLQSAKDLHAQIALQFSQIKIFPLHMKPVGPHPLPMFELHLLNILDFGALLPWLCLRRGEHSVLVRPQSGDLTRDYTTHAIWLGQPLSLIVEKLERSKMTQD